jgi:hypothetical protein
MMINLNLKPRPHFEDVVKKIVNGKKPQFKYPPRAYIMRDSLYYDKMEGMPDIEKVKAEESIKGVESQLTSLSAEFGITMPQLRDALSIVTGSNLPPDLAQHLKRARDKGMLEQAEKARNDYRDDMKDKLNEYNSKATQNKLEKLLLRKGNAVQGLEGLQANKDQQQQKAAEALQAVYKGFKTRQAIKNYKTETEKQGDLDQAELATIADKTERLDHILKVYKRGRPTKQQQKLTKMENNLTKISLRAGMNAFNPLPPIEASSPSSSSVVLRSALKKTPSKKK